MVLRGEAADRLDREWLGEALARSRPGVLSAIMREDPFLEGRTWMSLEPGGLAGALAAEGASPGESDGWIAVAALVEALDYPLEKPSEAVQFVRAAVAAFHGLSRSRADGGEAGAARRIADALAYAFATQDDRAETLRPGFGEWRSRLADGT